MNMGQKVLVTKYAKKNTSYFSIKKSYFSKYKITIASISEREHIPYESYSDILSLCDAGYIGDNKYHMVINSKSLFLGNCITGKKTSK